MPRGPATVEASTRFIGVFRDIKASLRRRTGAGPTMQFEDMVASGATSDPIIRRLKSDLLQYGLLRNAIVHQDRGRQAIAERHAATVGELERILVLLTEPPTVGGHFSGPGSSGDRRASDRPGNADDAPRAVLADAGVLGAELQRSPHSGNGDAMGCGLP